MDIATTLLEFGADPNAESKVLSYSKTMPLESYIVLLCVTSWMKSLWMISLLSKY